MIVIPGSADIDTRVLDPSSQKRRLFFFCWVAIFCMLAYFEQSKIVTGIRLMKYIYVHNGFIGIRLYHCRKELGVIKSMKDSPSDVKYKD
jgi:hypothetical protein